MNHRIVHFEIPCDHPESVMKFFSDVFGWQFSQFGNMDYWSVSTGDPSTPGINGGLMAKKHPDQPIVNTIQVESVEAHSTKISAAGGTIVVPKMAIPGVGWLAYFKDPDGNIHGIFEDDVTAG
ncbi:MAG: VOC family protein [Saprospiraceae bacterium]|nr:VOC family protein [Saprospiraceae bacterium]